jgi:DDE superfamily endonuclease
VHTLLTTPVEVVPQRLPGSQMPWGQFLAVPGAQQYMHQVMATFSKTGKEVVMVVDRSGLHRAHKLDATLAHYHNKLRFHFLPAHCGPHLNPIEGFWRVLKDTIGAGRCFPDLHQLYQRTRQVLMAHHERPIYAFHW